MPLYPISELKKKFGKHITEIFFEFYSERCDERALGLAPFLKVPQQIWLDPNDEMDGKIKLSPPLLTILPTAFTHDRILREGARIEEEIKKKSEKENFLKLQCQKRELFEICATIQNELRLLKVKNKKEKKYQNELQNAIENLKQQILEEMENAREKMAKFYESKYRNDQIKFEKKLIEQYNEKLEILLDSEKQKMRNQLEFLLAKETNAIVEKLEEEHRKRENEKEKQMDEYFKLKNKEMETKIMKINFEDTVNHFHVIFEEKIKCMQMMDDLRNKYADLEAADADNSSEHEASESVNKTEEQLLQLNKLLEDKNVEIQKWQNKTIYLANEFKQFIALAFNNAPHLDYMLQIENILNSDGDQTSQLSCVPN